MRAMRRMYDIGKLSLARLESVSEMFKHLDGITESRMNDLDANAERRSLEMRNDFLDKVADFKNEVKGEFREQIADFKNEVKEQIADFKSEVRGEFQASKGEFRVFKSEFHARVGSLEQKVGHMSESTLRKSIQERYGSEYAEQKTATCLMDLISFLPSSVFPAEDAGDHGVTRVVSLSEAVAGAIERNGVPGKFLSQLVLHFRSAASTDAERQAIKNFEKDPSNMNLFRAAVGGKSTAADQLERYFAEKDESRRIKLLANCKGPGILLMIYDIDPSLIFRNKKLRPITEVEFDIFGRTTVHVDEKKEVSCVIDIGEAKSSMDSAVIDQLGLRLDLLRLTLEHCLRVTGLSPVRVTQIGRFYLPKTVARKTDKEQATFDQWMANAAKKGFDLKIHHI